MIIQQVKQIIKAIGENNIRLNIMLWGPNGVGKTHVFREIAEELKWEFWLENVAAMDRTNIAGIPFTAEVTRKIDGQKILVQRMAYPEYVAKAMDGEIVVLFDEVNKGPKEAQGALFEFINERSINGKKLANNIIIGLTGNPPDDRFHTKITDVAFNDRMVHILITTSPSDTLDYFKSELKDDKAKNKIHKDILNYLEAHKTKVNHLDTRDMELPIKPKVSPRNWKERVNRIWSELNPIKEEYGITEDSIIELINGTLGDEAHEFIKFIKTKRQPLTINDIINLNPETLARVKIFSNTEADGSEKLDGESQMGALHPVCSELEHEDNSRIVRDNWENVLTFLTELPTSFSFRVMKKIAQRSSDQQFWKEKVMEPLVDPKTQEKLLNPDGTTQLRWATLMNSNNRQYQLEQDRARKYMEEQKLKASASKNPGTT